MFVSCPSHGSTCQYLYRCTVSASAPAVIIPAIVSVSVRQCVCLMSPHGSTCQYLYRCTVSASAPAVIIPAIVSVSVRQCVCLMSPPRFHLSVYLQVHGVCQRSCSDHPCHRLCLSSPVCVSHVSPRFHLSVSLQVHGVCQRASNRHPYHAQATEPRLRNGERRTQSRDGLRCGRTCFFTDCFRRPDGTHLLSIR